MRYNSGMTSNEIRKKYIDFFKSRNHIEIDPSPLVLENDPTTLFTSSGMQQLVPYLKGEPHPKGKRLVNSQPSFRAVDIEEVGDNRHTTFFEMLGNWSLGDYFKREQIPWFWEFLTKELGLPKEKLWISVFEGTKDVPKDTESIEIWEKLGIPRERIREYGVKKNWWSRSGTPDEMPQGEIGGPDSEVFYDFGTAHDPKYGAECHPNCECGRFLEIGNSVFIQYQKNEDGTLTELPQKNVDFGGGLERIAAAINAKRDMFETDLFLKIINKVEEFSGEKYGRESKAAMQVIADHIKASSFIISGGVEPSNKGQGYILRRLLRRAMVKMQSLKGNIASPVGDIGYIAVADAVLDTYKNSPFNIRADREKILNTISNERDRFGETLSKGLKELGRVSPFDLFQTYGFPPEITEELYKQKGLEFNRGEFDRELKKHQELSRASSSDMFRKK